MTLRSYLDSLEQHFEKGGKHEKWYALYEAVDTFFYRPRLVTRTTAHVRDGIDLKRMMITVWLCTFPAMFFGMWNVGYQANTILAGNADLLAAQQDWQMGLIQLFAGFDPNSLWDNFIHGAAYFLPIYLVTFVVGGAWEVLFASIRRHEVNEGFFVTWCLRPHLPTFRAAVAGCPGHQFWRGDRQGSVRWNRQELPQPGADRARLHVLRLSGADVG